MRCASHINLDIHVSVREERFLFVIFIASNTEKVNCAGAVLGDLFRRRSTGLLPGQGPEAILSVDFVETFTLSDYVSIDSETLLCLQIVQSELHPNSQVWGSGSHHSDSKESLSVYGLFHELASTPQGRTHLQKLLFRPIRDVEAIKERQRAISLLLQPDNIDKIKSMTKTLRRIRNIRTAIAQLRKGVESAAVRSHGRGTWGTTMHFAAACLRLREQVGMLSSTDGIPIFQKVNGCLAFPPSIPEVLTLGGILGIIKGANIRSCQGRRPDFQNH